MNSHVAKLLNQRGVKSIDDLDEEEKSTFNTWEEILSKEQLTTEDIKKFCQTQTDTIEGKWRDYNLESSKKSELIPYHTVYKMLLSVIDSPKSAREQLEQHLIQLLK